MEAMNDADVALLQRIVAESDRTVNTCIHYPHCVPSCANAEFRVGDSVEAQIRGEGAFRDATIVERDPARDRFTLVFGENRSRERIVRASSMRKAGCQGRCDTCLTVARIVTYLREHDRRFEHPPPRFTRGDVGRLRAYGLLPPLRLPATPTTPEEALEWQRVIMEALDALRPREAAEAPSTPWIFRDATNWVSEAAGRLQREYLVGPDGTKARALFHELTHHAREKQALCNAARLGRSPRRVRAKKYRVRTNRSRAASHSGTP